MGKIINSTFVSIDGVSNHMEVWHFAYIDDEPDQIALDQLRPSEALLMGRNTYDVYASSWPERDGGYADMINTMPTYVASTTLDKPIGTTADPATCCSRTQQHQARADRHPGTQIRHRPALVSGTRCAYRVSGSRGLTD